VRNYLYLDGIFGGLSVTPDMEVLGADGPIPGLFAAGDIACGRYVNDRLHKTEVINDYTWAITGGFMAANRAIENVK
jgi:succinate dehydrogenase/fumarate reductase flavoprotein subunit